MTSGSTPQSGGQSFVFYNDIWAFDGKSWKNKGTSGDERSGIGLAWNSRQGKIISFGGFVGRSLGDLRMLDNYQWKTIAEVPDMSASEPGFVYDHDRDKLIAFGGSKERGVVQGSTWEYADGWKKIEVSGPDGRQAFAMIYDSKRKKTVLFGGMGASLNTIFGDTWEYDGISWKKIDSAGPSPRVSMGFSYDSKRGLFIIFGGMGANGMLGDTWGWDGSKWKKLSATGPDARAMGYMAYDKNRDRTILFGGRIKWPQDANDTWEWDGEKWSRVQ